MVFGHPIDVANQERRVPLNLRFKGQIADRDPVYLYGIRSSLSNRAERNLLLLVGRISPAPADLFEKRVYSEQHRTRILTLDHDLGFLKTVAGQA